jgi:hypothetical protein
VTKVAAIASLVVHVTGPAVGSHTANCFLRLPAHVAGGGSMVYCLKTYDGMPGPEAILRDAGVMTFSLPRGSFTARVSVVMRFAADGKHARQTLHGRIIGGTGAYAHATGTIAGGGTTVEASPGHVTASHLRYVVAFRSAQARRAQ